MYSPILRCAILLLAISAPFSAFGEGTSHNGYWWGDLSKVSKLSYVVGFVEGASSADDTWATAHSSSKIRLAPSLISNVRDVNNYNNVRFGQLSDGLDEFYKDFQNMQIHLTDAIWIVKEQVKGTSQKLLDPQLENLRRTAASSGYDSNQ